MSALSVKKWLCVMLCVCLLFSLATPFALSEELPAVNAASETAAQPAPTVTSEPTAEPAAVIMNINPIPKTVIKVLPINLPHP